MDGYEKLISVMREQGGKKVNVCNIVLGIMESTDSCEINGNVLSKKDLYIAEHLTKRRVVDIDILVTKDAQKRDRIKSDVSDESTYIEPLKKGDKVLAVRISEDMYAIIERVV